MRVEPIEIVFGIVPEKTDERDTKEKMKTNTIYDERMIRVLNILQIIANLLRRLF